MTRARPRPIVVRAFTLAVVAFFVVAGCGANAPAPPPVQVQPSKPVVVTPVMEMTFSDGRYLVGSNVASIVALPPGRYTTDDKASTKRGFPWGCIWSTWRDGVFQSGGYANDGPVEVVAGQQLKVDGGCTWRTA
jgi:hypothetical protein